MSIVNPLFYLALHPLSPATPSAVMPLSDINVDEALERGQQQLKEDHTASSSLRGAIVVLM